MDLNNPREREIDPRLDPFANRDGSFIPAKMEDALPTDGDTDADLPTDGQQGMNINADAKCSNCHRDFADHDYVKDSITQYRCPVPIQETGYGGFPGGDPRTFHPTYESCSEKEIQNHKAACKLWDEAEARGETPEPESCPSGWIYDDNGEVIAHVLRMPYGIGVYVIEIESFFEEEDSD